MSGTETTAGQSAAWQEGEFFRDRLILVVDDEPFNVDLLRFELEDRGFQVVTAEDGVEALDLLKDGARPDLALLDVMMPRLDGFGLTREIRHLEGLEQLPIILLTAKSELEDKAEGFAARADDYVLKPFHIDDVVARVEVQLRIAGYLKRRRVQAEALSRIAMVGAAAHELAQPLAGASGYLQLLQAGLERQTLDPAAYAERLGRIHSCLVKTRDIATRLEQLERVALEDYPCGAQIISLQESARPETARDPDDPRLVLLAAEAGVGRDAALERDLVLHGAELVREETVAEHAAEVDLVLLSCLDRLDHVKPVLERLATLWDTPHLLSPPVLALLPGQSIGRATPGVELLRSSVDDVLQRPFRLEELLIRIRSRVRLQRLRLGDLRLQSLGAAQDIRRRALDGFVEKVDHCLASLARLEARPDGLADLLAEYACQLDGLTGTVRRLQARNIPGFPEPAQG